MWIGLPVEEIAHVTIVIRHVDPSEAEFKRILHEEIKPLLPIVLKIHPGIVMRGYKGDVPTMDVEFLNRSTEQALKEIYNRNYAQVPGHTAYPQLEAHVTVDTQERRDRVKPGDYVVMHAMLKRIGEKEIIDQI
jgi:hypothetical protein